jgi:hypothetical protein
VFQWGDISHVIDFDHFFGEMWLLGVIVVAQFLKGKVSQTFAVRSTWDIVGDNMLFGFSCVPQLLCSVTVEELYQQCYIAWDLLGTFMFQTEEYDRKVNCSIIISRLVACLIFLSADCIDKWCLLIYKYICNVAHPVSMCVREIKHFLHSREP